MAERTIPGLSPQLKARLRTLFRILGALSPNLAARLALRFFTTPIRRPVDAVELQFLQTSRQRKLRTACGTIRCYEWPGAGPTVLIVHGWYSHTGRFVDVIRALQLRSFHVVAFDAPAHGRSAGSRADAHTFQIAIAAVSEAYGPIHGVLAHSFGALNTASWLAGTTPASVRAAVLIGMPRDGQYLMESFALMLALSSPVVARLRELVTTRYGRAPEQFSAALLAEQIHIPVLLVHGSADELVPAEHSSEVAERLANGQVQIVEGLQHGAPLRDPRTVAYMVGFLRETLSS